MLSQIERHFKVAQRDDRFDAVLMHGVEHVIIKCETGFVRHELVAIRKNPAPGNGCAEALETKLSKEGNIVFVGMIEVNALVVRITFSGYHAICNTAALGNRSGCQNIADGRSAAILVPAAFQLVSGNCAAPQKIFR